MDKAQNAFDSSHLECAQMAAQIARLEAELTSLQDEHVSALNQVRPKTKMTIGYIIVQDERV